MTSNIIEHLQDAKERAERLVEDIDYYLNQIEEKEPLSFNEEKNLITDFGNDIKNCQVSLEGISYEVDAIAEDFDLELLTVDVLEECASEMDAADREFIDLRRNMEYNYIDIDTAYGKFKEVRESLKNFFEENDKKFKDLINKKGN